MNEVELKFKDKEIKRGGISFYSKSTALSFIEECKKMQLQILGIDGFFFCENATQPSMENSIDFTSKQFQGVVFPGGLFEEARRFLESRDDSLFFEIVCDE